MQFMSLGGWEPDEHSPYAARMEPWTLNFGLV